MTKLLTIYIGDLTHYHTKAANETMPLSAALIASYLECKFDNKISCRVFRYASNLIEQIDSAPPDILMLSNYVWNEELSLFVFRYAKQINSHVLTVMGGPNFSLDIEKQEHFMRSHPYLDIYIMGEGEKPSVNIVHSYIINKRDIEKMKNENLNSTVCINDSDDFCYGSYDNSSKKNIISDLNEIPSPWINGYLDEFFDGNLAPLIETSRGCPFKCTFCIQGTDHYRNVRRFSVDRIKDEINYITDKILELSPEVGYLRIADSNFGMYKEDVLISKTIRGVKKKYGWPVFVDATTGKNKKNSILETVKNLDGSLVMYNSVQSLNPEVLDNVKRKNIRPELMSEIQEEAASIGVKTLTETILSLPGETFSSHKQGLYKLIDMGIKQFTNYQCMLLKGSYMETDESRNVFGFKTSFRVLPRSFGVYSGNRIVEVEEVVTSTSTLDFGEYVHSRKLHLVLIVYYNGYRFEPLIKFLALYGITLQQLLDEILNNIGHSGNAVETLFESFARETSDELFTTRDACYKFYTIKENFDKFIKGEIGGNLLMKYFSIATFKLWDSTVRYAFKCAEILLEKVDIDYNQQFLDNIFKFMCNRLATGVTINEILSNSYETMEYDINSWVEQGCNTSFDEYSYEYSRPICFYLSRDKSKLLRNALNTYGADAIGLSKLVTRLQYSDQIKLCNLDEIPKIC